MVRLFFNIWPITTEKVAQNVVVAQSVERSLPTPEVYPIIGKLFYWTFNCLLFFLLNIFIDHHTVNSHLLMHVYNTVYELNSGQKKEIGYFYIYNSNTLNKIYLINYRLVIIKKS